MSILEDSSVYQYIVRKGMAEGRERGCRIGLEQGLEQGRQLEAASLILRQVERRCGPLAEPQRQRIASLPLQRLEALAEALLDFNGPVQRS